MGADFRFQGRLNPQPPTKPNPWGGNAITLPRLDLNAVAATEPPFTAVLESRRSIREQDFLRPISLPQLAAFLFRTARIRFRYQTEVGEFTSRPYPSGGASYELELYVTVNQCNGLDRGFYYYDPDAHTLSLVQRANEDMEAMLNDAWLSSARLCRPQVLITIASRFHRVSWKYSGIAYAAQLKNVGALYQTFYLVATAMNLAGCGLGLGNSMRFCRLAGTNYFEETSIGEFMLGTSL
jgi:SagB-type dehydrogenase family enzyme